MKRIISTILALAIGGAAITSAPVLADPYDGHNRQDNRDWRDNGHDRRDHRDWRDGDHRRQENRAWRRGERIERAEWYRYNRVDYRHYHLRQPPRGYEWRRVNDNFVLAAIASGLIADIIVSHR